MEIWANHSIQNHILANIIQCHERREDLLMDVLRQGGKSKDIEALALNITNRERSQTLLYDL